MSPPRYSAAHGGHGEVEEALRKLKHKPDERVEKRGHLEEERDDDDEDQDGELGARKGRGVGSEHAGDGSRRPKRRHGRVLIKECMGEARAQPANKIET